MAGVGQHHARRGRQPHEPHCRATPTECLPFLGRPVSSTISGLDRPTALHALAVERRQKAVAVVPKRPDTVGVPYYLAPGHLAQRRAIAFQAPLALNKILIHPDHHWKIDKSKLLTDPRSERFCFLHLSIFMTQ